MNVVESPPLADHSPIWTARCWLEEHERVVLATVISTLGSAPVPIGSQLVVARGDRFQGSVCGGCVEVDVISEAADVLTEGRTRLFRVWRR